MRNKEDLIIKIDSRGRFTIPKKLIKELSHLYRIYIKDHKIILEPVTAIPKRERWLFDPKNKKIVEKLKKALKQKATKEIDLDELEKDLK